MLKCQEKDQYSLIKNEEFDEENQHHENQNSAYASSTFKSICNLVGGIEGSGLLAMPYIVKIGGLPALVALVVIPLICYYTGKILIECLYDKDENGQKVRVRRNYRDLAEACWPRYGGFIGATIKLLSLVFVGSGYVVLCGSMLHGLLPDTPIPKRLWMVIAGVVGLPVLFIKHLSQVAWFSFLGIISLMISLTIILGYGASISGDWNVVKIPLWDFKGMLIGIAVLVYGYFGHYYMLTIEPDMRYPEQFNFVLAMSYILAFLLKGVFALGGFLTFYPNIDQVITNNISLRPLQIAASSLLFLNVRMSYPFLTKTFIQSIEDSIANESARTKLNDLSWYISIRIIVSIAVILPAIAIPHFALILSFQSSVSVITEAFIFPCLFHLYLKSDDEIQWYQKYIDHLIIVFGIIVSIACLVVSIRDIIKKVLVINFVES